MRPMRLLFALALAAFLACDNAPTRPHGFAGGFTGRNGFVPPGGGITWGSGGFAGGGGFVPFPWFRVDAGTAWSVDATSGIAVPASIDEWNSFISAKGLSISAPDAIWLLQEASGDAADSSGNGFTLTASGTGLAYQQAVAGWSRKAITFTDGGTGVLKSTSAALPDIATTSQLTLVFASAAAPAAQRQILIHGTTVIDQLALSINPLLRVKSASNQADGVANPTGVVRPWALRTNRTAGSCTGFTDVEEVSPTFSTSVTGKTIAIGAGTGTSPAMSALYAVEWHGAHAEMTDATLKALELAMGLTITW